MSGDGGEECQVDKNNSLHSTTRRHSVDAPILNLKTSTQTFHSLPTSDNGIHLTSNDKLKAEVESVDGGKVTRKSKSAKINACLDLLEQWSKESPSDKVIIFSQFTKMIALVSLLAASHLLLDSRFFDWLRNTIHTIRWLDDDSIARIFNQSIQRRFIHQGDVGVFEV